MLTDAQIIEMILDETREKSVREMACNILIGRHGAVKALELYNQVAYKM